MNANHNGVDAPDVTDEVLMVGIQQKNQEALNALSTRYKKLLRGLIASKIYCQGNIDDVLNGVLHEVWRKANLYSTLKGKPLGWIIRITSRRVIDNNRHEAAENKACAGLEESVKYATSTSSEDSGYTDSDQVDRVMSLMMEIPEAQATVVRLWALLGHSQQEIADLTHTPLSTVKTRLGLGLKKLRQMLQSSSFRHHRQKQKS
ncbi:MAG: RNA polymerase sigma factor [Patescibacteria group bacterium]